MTSIIDRQCTTVRTFDPKVLDVETRMESQWMSMKVMYPLGNNEFMTNECALALYVYTKGLPCRISSNTRDCVKCNAKVAQTSS